MRPEGNWASASGEAAFKELLENYPEMDAVCVAERPDGACCPHLSRTYSRLRENAWLTVPLQWLNWICCFVAFVLFCSRLHCTAHFGTEGNEVNKECSNCRAIWFCIWPGTNAARRSAGKRESSTPAACWGTQTFRPPSATCTSTNESLRRRRISWN